MTPESRIRELVQIKLLGRSTDGVGFVDELLALVEGVGEIHCNPSSAGGLVFVLGSAPPFEVEVDGGKGKLRMLCARLAVLCQESGGEFILYGGEGVIHSKALPTSVMAGANGAPQSLSGGRPPEQSCSVRLKNTTDAQEFTITAN